MVKRATSGNGGLSESFAADDRSQDSKADKVITDRSLALNGLGRLRYLLGIAEPAAPVFAAVIESGSLQKS